MRIVPFLPLNLPNQGTFPKDKHDNIRHAAPIVASYASNLFVHFRRAANCATCRLNHKSQRGILSAKKTLNGQMTLKASISIFIAGFLEILPRSA